MTVGLYKRLISFILSLFTLTLTITGINNPIIKPFVPSEVVIEPQNVEMLTVIENGFSDYKIVRGINASPSEKNAANILQRYLEQISGVQLSIVSDETEMANHEIIVGKTNREGSGYNIDREKLGDNGLIIKVVGEKLIIAGSELRGTLYGVYTFLEEILGCHWYTAELIVIPERDNVQIPIATNIEQIPTFEFRETDWISPQTSTEYRLANKLNGNYRNFNEEQGGNIRYTGGFCHTMASLLPVSLFNAHPEYFACGSLNGGQRTTDQPCLTNPDVLRIITDNVLSLLAGNPEAQIISVTQNDNMNFCICKNCLAVDLTEGSHAGTMLRFVNAVADAVKDAGYRDVKIDTFAYQYTRTAPKITAPRDNVIVRLCTIEDCYAHAFNDADCVMNSLLTKNFDNWAAICDNIYVWDYTTNYYNFLSPFPNFGNIQENMQFFADHSITGVYEEGNYAASSSNAEFAELRAYLLSKLLWDPYIDLDLEMNEFLQAYYGAGWQYIREYIDMTSEKTGVYPTHNIIFSSTLNPGVLLLTNNEVKYMDDLWTNAKALCNNDWQAVNIKLSELSWRYWKGCNMKSEFSRLQNPPVWQEANEKLYNDMKAAGVMRFSELKSITDKPDFTKPPYTWGVK